MMAIKTLRTARATITFAAYPQKAELPSDFLVEI